MSGNADYSFLETEHLDCLKDSFTDMTCELVDLCLINLKNQDVSLRNLNSSQTEFSV